MSKCILLTLLLFMYMRTTAQTISKHLLRLPNTPNWYIEIDTAINKNGPNIYNPNCSYSVYADQTKITSLTDGVVKTIFKIDKEYFVGIRYKQYLIVYSELYKLSVRKNQKVIKGAV